MEKLDSLLWLGTGFMLMLVVGLILLFLFYQTYLMKLRKREAELLLKASLNSEKNERKRIAADLHDGVLSDLTATRNLISIIGKNEIDVGQKEKLQELQEAINDTIVNTRAICHKLLPPLIGNFGLRLTLLDYFEKLNQGSAIGFSIDFPQEVEKHFDKEDAYELYRIVQEFTTNSMKHGNLSFFKLKVRSNAQEVLLELEDDGEPFDLFALYKTSTGNGFKNILSRIKVIDAHLKQQKKEKGNLFILSLKLKNESSNS